MDREDEWGRQMDGEDVGNDFEDDAVSATCSSFPLSPRSFAVFEWANVLVAKHPDTVYMCIFRRDIVSLCLCVCPCVGVLQQYNR